MNRSFEKRARKWAGRQKPRVPALAVAAATLLGAISRLYRLGAQPLWTDEVLTRWAAEAPWSEWLILVGHDSSPPLYILLLKAWLAFAHSEAAIRLLPALLGIACVPAAYFAAKAIFGTRAGVLTALVVAIHPYHLYYSQENRYVTLVTLAAMVTVWAYTRMWRLGGWRDVAGFAAAGAWLMYSHYYAGFILCALGLHYLLTRVRDGDTLLRLFAAAAAIALAFLPWVGPFLFQLHTGQPARETFDPIQQAFIAGTVTLAGGTEWSLAPLPFVGLAPGDAQYPRGVLLFLVPLILLALRGVAADLRRSEMRGVATVTVLVPTLIVMVVSQKMPIFRPKYLMPLIPLVWALAAGGLFSFLDGGVLRGRIAQAAMAFLLTVLLYGTLAVHADERFLKERWIEAMDRVAVNAQDGDALLVYNTYSAAAWIDYDRGGPEPQAIVSPYVHTEVPPADAIERRIERVARKHRRIWLLDYQAVVHDPDGNVLRTLRERFGEITTLRDESDPRFTLYCFAVTSEALTGSFANNVVFVAPDHLRQQVGEGWLAQGDGPRWMGSRGSVTLARGPGDDLVQFAFYAHLPYLGESTPTAVLSIEGEPVVRYPVTTSDLHVVTGVVPDDLAGKRVLNVELAFDRTFVPDEIFGNGDTEPRSALVYGFVMRNAGCLPQ